MVLKKAMNIITLAIPHTFDMSLNKETETEKLQQIDQKWKILGTIKIIRITEVGLNTEESASHLTFSERY